MCMLKNTPEAPIKQLPAPIKSVVVASNREDGESLYVLCTDGSLWTMGATYVRRHDKTTELYHTGWEKVPFDLLQSPADIQDEDL